jgi:hypothetical protein
MTGMQAGSDQILGSRQADVRKQMTRMQAGREQISGSRIERHRCKNGGTEKRGTEHIQGTEKIMPDENKLTFRARKLSAIQMFL